MGLSLAIQRYCLKSNVIRRLKLFQYWTTCLIWNALQLKTLWIHKEFLELRTTILSFRLKVEVGVDKVDMLLPPDFCKYKTKEILVEVMEQRRHGKTNKEHLTINWAVLQFARNTPFLLYFVIMCTQTRTCLNPVSKPIIPPEYIQKSILSHQKAAGKNRLQCFTLRHSYIYRQQNPLPEPEVEDSTETNMHGHRRTNS